MKAQSVSSVAAHCAGVDILFVLSHILAFVVIIITNNKYDRVGLLGQVPAVLRIAALIIDNLCFGGCRGNSLDCGHHIGRVHLAGTSVTCIFLLCQPSQDHHLPGGFPVKGKHLVLVFDQGDALPG